YYLVNGSAFDKTAASSATPPSLFPTSPATITGTVLVRLVNAGLRMHVPSIVAAQTGTAAVGGFQLIAEDGNVLPGVPRVQSEVFMAAGKTYDVMISAPAAGGAALPIFDRELSLSGNASQRDAGMLAYIGVNGNGIPSSLAGLGAAKANDDNYKVVCPASGTCNTLTISDVSKGVIANDINVYGVNVTTQPLNGVLNLKADGTFTYTPSVNWTPD